MGANEAVGVFRKGLPDGEVGQMPRSCTLRRATGDPGPLDGDFFGWSVSSAGDVDADGTPDVIAGSFGSGDGADQAGKAQIFSGADGSVLRTITSTTPLENFRL